jgi:hypothetical protein
MDPSLGPVNHGPIESVTILRDTPSHARDRATRALSHELTPACAPATEPRVIRLSRAPTPRAHNRAMSHPDGVTCPDRAALPPHVPAPVSAIRENDRRNLKNDEQFCKMVEYG